LENFRRDREMRREGIPTKGENHGKFLKPRIRFSTETRFELRMKAIRQGKYSKFAMSKNEWENFRLAREIREMPNQEFEFYSLYSKKISSFGE